MADLGNNSVFAQADASNASGTMPSWSGAAAPSTLDDAGRALQGAVTREWNWRNFTLTAGGTADAKTLTYSTAPAAYYNGQRFAFIANTTNTTSATLNVNSLGAKTIKKVVAGVLTNLSSGDMVSGAFVEVAYNLANDCFVWTGAVDSPYFTSIELGNASDTTITRSAAGVIAVEGGVVPKENRANTFSADQTFSGAAIVGNATDQFKASVSGVVTTSQFGSSVSGGHFKISYDRGTGGATFTAGTIASPVNCLTVDSSGAVLAVGSGGLGYGTGSGGTVTQGSTSGKATIVTLNKTNGQITMNNAALAAGASITFQFNNTTIAATDVVVVNPGNFGTYTASTYFVTAGACGIRVTNISGGSLSEAVTINFAVIKATTS